MMHLKRIAESLPQFSLIEPSAIDSWLQRVLKYQPDKAEWLVGRLAGIGGSEIGAVIRGVKDLNESGFSTLDRVVSEKLMLRLPMRQTVHMTRGNVLEELAMLAFKYRYKAVDDGAAMKQLRGAPKRAGYEWLVGNPDLIVRIGSQRILVDTKVPNNYSEDIEFDYSAQVHHYDLMCRMASIKNDAMVIAKLDLASEFAESLVASIGSMSKEQVHDLARTIATVNVPGMRIVGHVVERNRDLQMDILECGGFAWSEYVMRGEVPEQAPVQFIELGDAELKQIADYQHQYAMAKSGIKYLNDVVAQAGNGISQLLAGRDFEGKALPLPVLTASRSLDKAAIKDEAAALAGIDDDIYGSKKYSEKALLDEIKRLNGDVEAPHLFDDAGVDFNKAKAFLEKRGVDVRRFESESVALRMSTTKDGREAVAMYESRAGDGVGRWIHDNSLDVLLAEYQADDALESAGLDDFSSETVAGPGSDGFLADDDALENTAKLSPRTSRGQRLA